MLAFEKEALNGQIFSGLSVLNEWMEEFKPDIRHSVEESRDDFLTISRIVNNPDLDEEDWPYLEEATVEHVKRLTAIREKIRTDKLRFREAVTLSRALYHATRMADFCNPCLRDWHREERHRNHVSAN